jgi:hypothetical protein
MPHELYETDFHAWALTAARQLREGRLSEADIEHIAEQVEDMAGKERRELRSRLATIMEHLLKLRLTRGTVLDENRSAWSQTIARERGDLEALLEESPSLKRHIPELLPKAYRQAAQVVAAAGIAQTKLIPKTSPFKPADVLSGRK